MSHTKILVDKILAVDLYDESDDNESINPSSMVMDNMRNECKKLSLHDLLEVMYMFLDTKEPNKLILGKEDKCFRYRFVPLFGWSIPTLVGIDKILDETKEGILLELGAGLGLWAHMLRLRIAERKLPITVIATSKLCSYYDKEEMNNTWTDIEILDSREAIIKYKDASCTFICWGAGTIPNVILSETLIVIGDSCNGCTDYYGNPDIDEDNFTHRKVFKSNRRNIYYKSIIECKDQHVIQFYGIRDVMRIYKEKRISS